MSNGNQNQDNQVVPYSFGTAACIVVALTLLDSVGCIVLVVGAYIFTKKGHQGLGVALAIANLAPDALPLVDEIFGFIAVVIPYIKSREEGKSVAESVKASIDSSRQYNQTKQKVIQQSNKVAQKINSSQNQDMYYDVDYDDNDDYYDRS